MDCAGSGDPRTAGPAQDFFPIGMMVPKRICNHLAFTLNTFCVAQFIVLLPTRGRCDRTYLPGDWLSCSWDASCSF